MNLTSSKKVVRLTNSSSFTEILFLYAYILYSAFTSSGKALNISAKDDELVRRSTFFDEVKFISSPTLSAFLNDLYDATEVITVDSAAVHFREGIGKRCLALYNSFDKASRTKYYKHITAVNIKSECDKQPCFKHELNKGDLCEKVKKWQYSAPCFRSESNKFLQPELKRIFNEYFK